MKKVMILLFLCCCQLAKADTKEYNIMDYGAVGDGRTDDAKAIQKAIDEASLSGGRVIMPSGHVFLSGPVQLRSNIELEVQVNAKLLANPAESVYTRSAFRDNKGEGTIWLGGEKLVDVTLCGSGTIDGNGISFMGKESGDSYELKPFKVTDPRPHLLTIIGGENIRIRDLTIRNSAYWTVHLIGCNDVAMDNLTVMNSLKVRNSDGIDLDHSRNVRISNCYIESGDDCICLKNRREYQEFGPCENIVVSNCTMTSRSCAVKIGSENVDSIRHVLINNCIIKNSNRGIGIQNRDEGTVTDVVFSNILISSHLFSDTWWGKAEPIYVTAYPRANAANKDGGWRFARGQTVGRVGRVSHIYFSNIKCVSENGVYVGAESAGKISGVTFDGVDILINKSPVITGGVYDRRPANVEGLLKGRTSAFYLEHARNITIRNSSVNWGNNRPSYFAHVLESHDITGLRMINLDGQSAFPGKVRAIKRY